MPTIEEILPELSKAKVFSVADARHGFWQVKLDEPSSYLTTFWTPFGRYRWLRMPFGIATAPEEYQRRQHEVLEGLPGIYVIADDILITGQGESKEEALKDHDRNLVALLERAREVNLKLNPKKLKLRLSEVPFIGHLLTSTGVKPDPEKMRAVQEMPVPDGRTSAEKVKAVQRFLGFVNYLAKFVPHLADECEPLRRLTDKDADWVWEKHHQDAFNRVKQLGADYPVLRYYDVNLPVTIQCDSIETGLGAALLQDGQPVAFASRTLTSTERGYAQIEKECLAIVFACERFNQYLFGRNSVSVQSDHKPPETIFVKPLTAAPKRLQGMLLRLQKFNLKVGYVKGSEMFLADTLSRTIEPLIAEYWTYRDEIGVYNGVLYKGDRVIVPTALRKEMIKRIHASHQGQQACLRRAKDALFWPGMSSQIKKAVSNCSLCAEYQTAQPKEPLITPELPSRPWSIVAQDLYSFQGNNFLITVDAFSGYWEVDKLPQTTSPAVIDVTKQHFARYGIPDRVYTDNGPQFDCAEYTRFSNAWQFEHYTSSPYHSQSNGIVEAAVKTAKTLQKKASEAHRDQWLSFLDYRNTPTEGMDSSPVQRLTSKRTKTLLPVAQHLLEPEIQSDVERKLTKKRRKAKKYFDRGS
ncbi:Retrovirus-related Pol polyprotein from transposon 17.6 [Acropora cervicornis]|uniref:Retrovirus-related Pol polyprotein from transposon 17.6 n=1 Tax=Acropora cervicornis TaxID=6130 RepID=A0AAD9Q9B9_ACRCE|nr:Retrovirus-related Pol polyprotein from transposon 17.6 [Acropora cervicornis]